MGGMSVGVIYVAINQGISQYLIKSVTSLLKFHPDMPINVYSDYTEVDWPVNWIRDTLPDMIANKPAYPDRGIFGKVWFMHNLPWDVTIFLDHDTYFVEQALYDIAELLVYGKHDVAFAHDSGMIYPHLLAEKLPASMMTMNAGVIGFRRSDRVRTFWKDWWNNMLALNETYGDQLTFIQTLYNHEDIRYAVLPEEYNFRFIFPRVAYMPVKILHGRSGDIESVASNINKIHSTNRLWHDNKMLGYHDKATGEWKGL
jgi:hypothetical protein